MIAQLLCLLARIGIFCSLVLPAAGWACSPPADYKPPSNFELVQQADLIVLALVIAGPELPAADGKPVGQTVQIAPMQVLKGVLPANPVSLSGIVGGERGDYEAAPTPLTAAHYSARSGRCIRQIYAKGNLVLALFKKTAEGFRPIDTPFARAVEDVESFDSLWVRTARLYVAMQERTAGPALREAAAAERDRLRARTSDMEAQAVAADLGAWLEPSNQRRALPGAWTFDDAPDRITIGARGVPDAGFPQGPLAALTCPSGDKTIELVAEGPGKLDALALMIGTERFAASEVRPAASSNGREIAGRIALTPELDRLLKTSAGPFAVAVDGQPAYRGEASDALQKFALRCETLLRP